MAKHSALDGSSYVRYNNNMFVLRTLSGWIITLPGRKVKEDDVIRRMEAADLDAVAEIWLASNLDAHDFIPAEYWRGNFQAVKAQLPEAEVYVCEEDGRLSGFIGLEGEYIAGLFVAKPERSRGVGKQLLDAAKAAHDYLELRVYAENWPAVKFYYREGFTLCSQDVDGSTGADEYLMAWWA